MASTRDIRQPSLRLTGEGSHYITWQGEGYYAADVEVFPSTWLHTGKPAGVFIGGELRTTRTTATYPGALDMRITTAAQLTDFQRRRVLESSSGSIFRLSEEETDQLLVYLDQLLEQGYFST